MQNNFTRATGQTTGLLDDFPPFLSLPSGVVLPFVLGFVFPVSILWIEMVVLPFSYRLCQIQSTEYSRKELRIFFLVVTPSLTCMMSRSLCCREKLNVEVWRLQHSLLMPYTFSVLLLNAQLFRHHNLLMMSSNLYYNENCVYQFPCLG